MGEEATGQREGVQVISRVAELLRLLGAEPNGLTIGELAKRTGLPRSTAHRLTAALAAEGFVRVSPSGALRIGPALVGIAVGSRRDLRHEVAPFAEALSRRLQETVDVAVLDAGEVLFIEQFASRHALRVVSEVGTRLPLHATASGKVLLAALPPDEVERLLPRRLKRYTEHTITERKLFLAEVDLVRAGHIAYDREEHTLGVSALGTLVEDEVGLTASLTVVLPAARLPENEERIVQALLQTREEMRRALLGG